MYPYFMYYISRNVLTNTPCGSSEQSYLTCDLYFSRPVVYQPFKQIYSGFLVNINSKLLFGDGLANDWKQPQ